VRVFDSHQHFWQIGGPGHSWPDAGWPGIYRDFLPADLRVAAEGVNLVGTVLVQSQPADADTDWMLAVAGDAPLIEGIVGWADLEAEDAPARITELARRPKLVGLRPMLQAMDDTEWLLRPSVEPGLAAMVANHLRFDALVQPRHLAMLRLVAERWPELPMVIDHAAKPDAAAGTLDPWREEIAALATLPHVHCKLSGLRTEQAPRKPADALSPFVEHLVAVFGDRLMWGSDWPVLLHAGDGYRDWVDAARRLARLAPDAEQWLFEGAARRFYGLVTD